MSKFSNKNEILSDVFCLIKKEAIIDISFYQSLNAIIHRNSKKENFLDKVDIAFYQSLNAAIYRNSKKEDFLDKMKKFLKNRVLLSETTERKICEKLSELK